jgi:6-phosphogluconate dehydrogenase
MIGLGVMGRNLVINIADHGFTVSGFDIEKDKVKSLQQESNNKKIYATSDLADFINSLKRPRAVMLLVPAGNPVDIVISELKPLLDPGDLIIDAGNSHFTDTNKRTDQLREKNIEFLGVGISGGEEGARHGPSIMPGGSAQAYERVRAIFEAVSAKVNDDPCVTYLGPGSAGHYVKMIHNGIEYGIMQLIAETYDLMKRGLKFSNQQLNEIYHSWNNSELNSYLIEITANIFIKQEAKTNALIIDKILPVAEQKGTGMWTSQSSLELQVPVPTIDAAVTMRDVSRLINEREQASQLYSRDIRPLGIDSSLFVVQLKNALYVSMIITYAQGMALLSVASQKYNYRLNLEAIARIWRGGCIIRANLLEDIREAYADNMQLDNLLLNPNMAKKIMERQEHLRQVISHASHLGIPTPALMASLSYLDALRSNWSPANLIQAQRDYFGSHTYERTDIKGTFHTNWEENISKVK